MTMVVRDAADGEDDTVDDATDWSDRVDIDRWQAFCECIRMPLDSH